MNASLDSDNRTQAASSACSSGTFGSNREQNHTSADDDNAESNVDVGSSMIEQLVGLACVADHIQHERQQHQVPTSSS